MGYDRAIIIDDDAEFRKQVRTLLLRYFSDTIEVVAEVPGVTAAIRAIHILKPTILFLDMELSDGNGFEILDAFQDDARNYRFSTLIISNFPEFMKKAFRYGVVEFLVKGFSTDEFCEHVQHLLKTKQAHPPAKEIVSKRVEETKSESAADFASTSVTTSVADSAVTIAPEPLVLLRSQRSSLVVNPLNIVLCDAQEKNTVIHYANGDRDTTSLLLREIESTLKPYGIMRVYRSYCVNVRYLARLHSPANPNKASIEFSEKIPLPSDKRFLRIGEKYRSLLIDAMRAKSG
jgi:two-component system LytT family response regulator